MKQKSRNTIYLAYASDLIEDGMVKTAFVEVGGDFNAVIGHRDWRHIPRGDGSRSAMEEAGEAAVKGFEAIEKACRGYQTCILVEYNEKNQDIESFYSSLSFLNSDGVFPPFWPMSVEFFLSTHNWVVEDYSLVAGLGELYKNLIGEDLVVNDCYSIARATALICEEIQKIWVEKPNNVGHFLDE